MFGLKEDQRLLWFWLEIKQILMRKGDREIFFSKAHIYLREVTVEEGEKKARELNVLFIETSAKAGHNVSENINNLLYLSIYR